MEQGLKGKKLIIFYDDGVAVKKRQIFVTGEDENFIYARGGYFYNKTRIIRMEDINAAPEVGWS